jgi:hypothetical protein
MLTHPENFKSSHIYNIKKKLQNNYETYRKFKFIFRYETYISDIRNISHRNIILFICLPQQGVMMSVFAKPDPVFDHGNNRFNI